MYIDKNLTEKDLLTDLIYSQRQIWNTYNCALIESSCKEFKQIILQCQSNILQAQSSILKAMEIRGWIDAKQVNEREIKKIFLKHDENYISKI